MKKIYFITLAVILMCSCAKDIKTSTQIHQRSKSHDNIEVIPVEKALNTLERFLSENALAPTKSNMPRKYGKVSTYYKGGITTKSETGEGCDEIPTAYIVNFDNDEGFAVLGANSRVPDIVAVTEKGHINPNDLTCGIGTGAVTKSEAEETQRPDNNYNFLLDDMDESEIEEFNNKVTITRDSLFYSVEDDDYFVGDRLEPVKDTLWIPSDLVRIGLDNPFTDDGGDDNGDNNGGDNNGGDGNGNDNGGNDGSNPGSGSDSGSGSDNNNDSRKYNIKEPMLTYSWGQGSPYNRYCKRGLFKKKDAWTGCSTTAMAMIVAYNEFPKSLTINGTGINYSGIKSKKDADDLSEQHKEQVALLMGSIFNFVMKVTNGSYTLISPEQIKNRMESFQYANVNKIINHSLSDATISEISRMLGENKPVFISAIPKNWSHGHSWVIDGAKYSPDNKYLLHMNFGWRGYLNGYFATDCLNPAKAKEYDNSSTQYDKDEDYEYTWHFRVITYDVRKNYPGIRITY